MMNIPLFEKDGFIICFEAQEESQTLYSHFKYDCDWSDDQIKEIEDCAWFCAKVSAWKDGKELGTTYLGYCCYTSEEEFYTGYKDDYFAQMVEEAIGEARHNV
jgi:hypothetical protein